MSVLLAYVRTSSRIVDRREKCPAPTTRKIAYVIGCAGFRNVWPADLGHRRRGWALCPSVQSLEPASQRLPRPAQLLDVRLDARDSGVDVQAALSRGRAVLRGPLGDDVRPGFRVPLHAPDGRRETGRLQPPMRGPGQLDRSRWHLDDGVSVPLHGQRFGTHHAAEQRVARRGVGPRHRLDTHRLARRVRLDDPAEGDRGQLVAEADPQGGHVILGSRPDQVLRCAQPRHGGVVVRSHRSAEDEQSRVCREVTGEGVTGIRAAHPLLDAGLGQPPPDPGRRAAVLVLDDKDEGHSQRSYEAGPRQGPRPTLSRRSTRPRAASLWTRS